MPNATRRLYRGSEWRKWDLHVHTPASYDWDSGCKDKAEDIVKKAIAENISIITITDHHTVKGIDEIVKTAKGKNITILPGVELRTDKGNKGIHIIGIFDTIVTSKTIYDKLLCQLNLSDGDVKKKGDKDIYCNFEDACQKIHELGGLVLLHAGNKSSGIEQLDSDVRATLKKDLAFLVDIFEVSGLKQVGDYRKIVFPKIKQEFPCIITSDACDRSKLKYKSGHSTEVIGKKFSWIKADPTFEGLKQIMYEPELRVRVQEDNPSEEETFAKIEALEVDFPSDLKIKDKDSTEAIPFCIQGKQEIRLSSNLTCVIGGRGSGKSTLIHILYNLVPGRDVNRLDEVNSPLFNLQLESRDELGKARSITKADIPASTEFFLQNEVEKFAKDINEMSILVRARLYGLSAIDDTQKNLQQLESEWQTAVSAVDELIEAYDEITRIDNQIKSLENQKDTLKKQTDVISSKEYKNLQKDVEELANKISSFETYEKEYKRILLEIATLTKSISRLNWNEYGGQTALDNFSAELQNGNETIQSAFTAAKKKYEKADYATKLNDKKAKLKKFLKDKGLSPESIGEVAAATQQIANLEKEIRVLQQGKVPHQDIYEQKEETLRTYKETYDSYKEKFESVTGQLQEDLGNLKFDEQQGGISFYLRANNELLKEEIAGFIKDSNPSKVILRANDIKSVIFNHDSITLDDLINDPSKIAEVVNSSEKADVHTQVIQELVSDPIFVEKLHLRMKKYHFDVKNIQVQTKLGEKLLQNTSFGERCGIVMAIALVAGTNPIVIDQPEDNLDGKYISNVIVPLIRNQKQRRQIILVTRDANIAIGGDSELILILDKEESGTALSPTAIENKDVRPKYIWILDGGEIAFQKREEKYSLQKRR